MPPPFARPTADLSPPGSAEPKSEIPTWGSGRVITTERDGPLRRNGPTEYSMMAGSQSLLESRPLASPRRRSYVCSSSKTGPTPSRPGGARSWSATMTVVPSATAAVFPKELTVPCAASRFSSPGAPCSAPPRPSTGQRLALSFEIASPTFQDPSSAPRGKASSPRPNPIKSSNQPS